MGFRAFSSGEILSLRLSLRLSQNAFAKELGVALSTVQRWETNKSKPSLLALAALTEMADEKEGG